MCFVAGLSDGKFNTFDAPDSQNVDSGQLFSGPLDEEESSAAEQPHLSPAEAHDNCSNSLYDDTGLLSNDPAEEPAAAEGSVKDTEEDDDSEGDQGQSYCFSTSVFNSFLRVFH